MSDQDSTKPHNILVVSWGCLNYEDSSLAFNFYNVPPEERTDGWQDRLVEKHAKDRATERLLGCYDDGFSFEKNDLHSENDCDFYLNEALIFPVTPNFQFSNTVVEVEFRHGAHIACWFKKDEDDDEN